MKISTIVTLLLLVSAILMSLSVNLSKFICEQPIYIAIITIFAVSIIDGIIVALYQEAHPLAIGSIHAWFLQHFDSILIIIDRIQHRH